ncbi:MAG: hypothetical protein HOI50_14575 [Verrucomicrobia bacterium]|nr:hypothetical protein [Verrucomicrobiota bacterium]
MRQANATLLEESEQSKTSRKNDTVIRSIYCFQWSAVGASSTRPRGVSMLPAYSKMKQRHPQKTKELKEDIAIQVSIHRLACPFVQSQLV